MVWWMAAAMVEKQAMGSKGGKDGGGKKAGGGGMVKDTPMPAENRVATEGADVKNAYRRVEIR